MVTARKVRRLRFRPIIATCCQNIIKVKNGLRLSTVSQRGRTQTKGKDSGEERLVISPYRIRGPIGDFIKESSIENSGIKNHDVWAVN